MSGKRLLVVGDCWEWRADAEVDGGEVDDVEVDGVAPRVLLRTTHETALCSCSLVLLQPCVLEVMCSCSVRIDHVSLT